MQLPGVKDPKKALEIIGKTAQLEFKLLDEETTLWNELPSLIKAGEEEAFLNQWKNKLPEGDEIVFQKNCKQRNGRSLQKTLHCKKKKPYLQETFLQRLM